MNSNKQTSEEKKIKIISMDEEDITQINTIQNQQLHTKFTSNSDGLKPQPIQINSLESLRYVIEVGPSSIIKQKVASLSPQKKFGNLSLKANNSLASNYQNSEISSISEINSMDLSSLEFAKHKQPKQHIDEFEMEMEMNDESKSDSPQKLRKQFKKFPKSENISLLCPPQDLWQKSYQFMDQQYSQIEQETENNLIMQTVHEFLQTPLPSIQNSYMRYIFEIHVYKYTFTFNTCYEFYMRNSFGDMIHLARSEKDSLTVSSSHLLYATNPHKSGDKQFVAKLKYNTGKSQYNLYDIDEKENPNQPRKFLATGFYDKPLGDQRDIKLYVPKLQFSNNDFIKSETNKNLTTFYKENESAIYRQVQMLKTVPIPKENEAKVREQLELKNEGRRILVVNEEGQEKFYMGKKQNQRYVILGSGGLTPLQIFTLAILNLDH